MTEQPGTTKEAPLYFKWVHDDDGKINWGKIILMLGVTILSGYLATQSQRVGSNPDFVKTLRMKVAKSKINTGVKVQRIGKAIEESGWTVYEAARQ